MGSEASGGTWVRSGPAAENLGVMQSPGARMGWRGVRLRQGHWAFCPGKACGSGEPAVFSRRGAREGYPVLCARHFQKPGKDGIEGLIHHS